MIIKLIKNPNSNSVEATWIEEKTMTTSVLVEKDIDGELLRVKENKDIAVETIIHCQSFADSQIDLLKQTAKDFNTPISKEQELIIKDVIENIVLPTQQELEAIALENEKQRVLSIKQEAGRIIEIKYPSYKQNNILMGQNTDDIKIMNDYILAIRNISNNAEQNKTLLSDINWSL